MRNCRITHTRPPYLREVHAIKPVHEVCVVQINFADAMVPTFVDSSLHASELFKTLLLVLRTIPVAFEFKLSDEPTETSSPQHLLSSYETRGAANLCD